MAKYQSLCEFVADNGGLRLFRSQQDTVGAGELRAMNAELWHRAVPFRKKLVRLEAGMCPDEAALWAWEAGYFPELGRRPDVQEFLDAIDGELHGKLVYTLEDTMAIYEAEMQEYEREETMADFRAAVEIPGRVIPAHSERVSGINGGVVYLYETMFVTKKGREGKQFYAKAFLAGEVKHAWHHVFPSHEARLDKVNEFLATAGELV